VIETRVSPQTTVLRLQRIAENRGGFDHFVRSSSVSFPSIPHAAGSRNITSANGPHHIRRTLTQFGCAAPKAGCLPGIGNQLLAVLQLIRILTDQVDPLIAIKVTPYTRPVSTGLPTLFMWVDYRPVVALNLSAAVVLNPATRIAIVGSRVRNFISAASSGRALYVRQSLHDNCPVVDAQTSQTRSFGGFGCEVQMRFSAIFCTSSCFLSCAPPADPGGVHGKISFLSARKGAIRNLRQSPQSLAGDGKGAAAPFCHRPVSSVYVARALTRLAECPGLPGNGARQSLKLRLCPELVQGPDDQLNCSLTADHAVHIGVEYLDETPYYRLAHFLACSVSLGPRDFQRRDVLWGGGASGGWPLAGVLRRVFAPN